MNYCDHIVRDPKICAGVPVMKGTRIPLRIVLGSLAHGERPEKIVCEFPTLTLEAVWAAIAFAATSAEEDIPYLPPLYAS